MNQLRHVLYLKDREHTLELMKRHAEILAPKFEMVLKMLRSEQRASPTGIIPRVDTLSVWQQCPALQSAHWSFASVQASS